MEIIRKIIFGLFMCSSLLLTSCLKRVKKEGNKEKKILVDTLKTIEFSLRKYPVIIETKGFTYVPKHNIAFISTPVEGIVTKLLKKEGVYCKRGEAIAILEHPSIIELQKNYLELKYQLEYLEEDFKRQGNLSIEYAVPLKRMQESQAKYYSIKSKMQAIGVQLEIMGINPEALENGIVKKLRINAPITGYLEDLNVYMGEYVQPSKVLGKVFDLSQVRVKVELDQSYLGLVNKNDTINVIYAGSNKKAIILGIEKTADANILMAVATFLGDSGHLYPGFDVKVEINGLDTFDAFCVPRSAIWENKKGSYIRVIQKKNIIREKVQVLKIFNSNVIIKPIHNIPEGTKVVIEGVD